MLPSGSGRSAATKPFLLHSTPKVGFASDDNNIQPLRQGFLSD